MLPASIFLFHVYIYEKQHDQIVWGNNQKIPLTKRGESLKEIYIYTQHTNLYIHTCVHAYTYISIFNFTFVEMYVRNRSSIHANFNDKSLNYVPTSGNVIGLPRLCERRRNPGRAKCTRSVLGSTRKIMACGPRVSNRKHTANGFPQRCRLSNGRRVKSKICARVCTSDVQAVRFQHLVTDSTDERNGASVPISSGYFRRMFYPSRFYNPKSKFFRESSRHTLPPPQAPL